MSGISTEVRWLAPALADVERLHAFLKDKNPDAAMKAVTAILQGAENLRQHPKSGKPMPDESSRREWIIPFDSGAYVLRYMLDNNGAIVIIRVWHSRESRLN